jgi:hypothetical protein
MYFALSVLRVLLNSPRALPQAITFRAFGAGNELLDQTSPICFNSSIIASGINGM